MPGISFGPMLGITSAAIGQTTTTPSSTLSLTSLNTELRNLNSDEARRALILRLFGPGGSANLPENLSGYNRTTLTSIFHNLKGILLNRNINIDNATRARGFRFLANLASGISSHISTSNPFDESVIMFDQYSEAYGRMANSLESIPRILTTPRTENTLRVPVGSFSNLPYNALPDGVTFNAETPDVRSLIKHTLVNAINSVPQNIEIISPIVTEDNHEAVERDFEKLQQLVREMRSGFLLNDELQTYSRLLLLCASYADELSRYHGEGVDGNFSRLATEFMDLRAQTQRRIREAAPYTGPELNNPEHRLTSLLNGLRTLNTQVQSAENEQARNNLRRTHLMNLFGSGTPNCPRVEDFFHRSTSTGVFYDLLGIVENPEINIPNPVKVRALRFLSTYANNLADYIDRNRQGEDTDPSTIRFLAFGTTCGNLATTIEALDSASGQIEDADMYIRLPIGSFLGLPAGIDSSTQNISGSVIELNRLTKSMFIRLINDAWDRRGITLSASRIRNDQDLEKAIREFERLRNLAISISVSNSSSSAERRAVSHIWRLCSSYALSIREYYAGTDDSESRRYGEISISCTTEAYLSRELPIQPLSESVPRHGLQAAVFVPNPATIETLVSRANTPQAKIDLARRLFEPASILLAPPTHSSGLSYEVFNSIRSILEDSTLNINIHTRTRGFRFLSGYARNLAQTFPNGNENRRLLIAYATACDGAANQLGQQGANVGDILATLRPLSTGGIRVARLPVPPPRVNQDEPADPPPVVQQLPPIVLNREEGLPPIPSGSVGNVELTLQGGQTVELTNFASGLPAIRQRLTYQHVITFNHSQLIPHANITHSGGNIQAVTTTNENVTSTNIPGVCYIHSRRNNDGTYTNLIGVYSSFRDTISIGNRQAFRYQAPEQAP